MENMKNLCAPIPEALHAQVMQEKDQLGQTLSEYVQQVLNEHFNGKDGKAMDKTRTMAFQAEGVRDRADPAGTCRG